MKNLNYLKASPKPKKSASGKKIKVLKEITDHLPEIQIPSLSILIAGKNFNQTAPVINHIVKKVCPGAFKKIFEVHTSNDAIGAAIQHRPLFFFLDSRMNCDSEDGRDIPRIIFDSLGICHTMIVLVEINEKTLKLCFKTSAIGFMPFECEDPNALLREMYSFLVKKVAGK